MPGEQRAIVWVLVTLGLLFFLALAALFAIIGGYVLAGLLVVVVVLLSLPIMALGAGVMGIARLVRRRAPVTVLAPPTTGQAVEMPVVVRLTEMQGSCARKIRYAVGDEFIFESGEGVTPEMCGPTRHGLLPYVQRLRGGEEVHEAKIQCPLSGSILVFQLRPKELASAA